MNQSKFVLYFFSSFFEYEKCFFGYPNNAKWQYIVIYKCDTLKQWKIVLELVIPQAKWLKTLNSILKVQGSISIIAIC